MSELLLDTCAVLWVAKGSNISAESQDKIGSGRLYISPITAWEIANLVRKDRIALTLPALTWFNRAMKRMQATLTELSLEILTSSCALPGTPPADPADRMIIATARETGLQLVTRDAAILDYGRAGHIRTLEC